MAGELPDGLTPNDDCPTCGDLIWACLVWRKQYPWLDGVYAQETA